jgi:hypothetical protein
LTIGAPMPSLRAARRLPPARAARGARRRRAQEADRGARDRRRSEDSARRIGLAVANSPLVKTAIAGEDANWGRVVMAVGKAGEPADRDKLSIGLRRGVGGQGRACRWPTTTRRRSPRTSRAARSRSRSISASVKAAPRCGPAT